MVAITPRPDTVCEPSIGSQSHAPGWDHLFDLLCSPGRAEPSNMAFVRAGGGRALVFPNNDPDIARSSLRDFRINPSRSEAIASSLLTSAVRSRALSSQLLPDLEASFGGHLTFTPAPLWDGFEEILGPELATFSTVLRNPGPDWTPIIHLYSRSGERLAVAKIGFSSRARASVHREADALAAHEASRVSWVAPRALGLVEQDGLTALLMAPLPIDLAHFHRRLDADLLREVQSLPQNEFDARHHHYLSEACSRLGLDIAGQLEDALFADIPRGRCHGDLVPWNLAQSGGRLVIWDWEYSFRDAPCGFDAIQSRYRVLRENGRKVDYSLQVANRDAQRSLMELGLDDIERRTACVIHCIDAAVRISAGVDVAGSNITDANRALSVARQLFKRSAANG